jgi:hypothetical protein
VIIIHEVGYEEDNVSEAKNEKLHNGWVIDLLTIDGMSTVRSNTDDWGISSWHGVV